MPPALRGLCAKAEDHPSTTRGRQPENRPPDSISHNRSTPERRSPLRLLRQLSRAVARIRSSPAHRKWLAPVDIPEKTPAKRRKQERTPPDGHRWKPEIRPSHPTAHTSIRR